MSISSDNLIRRFILAAGSDGLQRRSLTMTAIVGTLLNLINQGDSLWGDHSLDVVKLMLTYLVPYCVATVAGAGALMHKREGRSQME